LERVTAGDRPIYEPQLPTKITAHGPIDPDSPNPLTWTRMIREGQKRTTNAEAKAAEAAISGYLKAALAQQAALPVLAYYGAGRAWLPSNQPISIPSSTRMPQRLDAYRKCLDTRIRDVEIHQWFLLEYAAFSELPGGRPGFHAVKQAVLNCIPGADGFGFDSSLQQIVLSIDGFEQPFYNLSAGQRMMVSMVADIAIKAVKLNSYLLGPNQPGANDPKQVLSQSPGVILIDELDVHLHPKWQRRVASDLKRTFKNMQFVCTSHSPQVIGEVLKEEVRLLEPDGIRVPSVAFGADSNWILDHVMDDASSQNPKAKLLQNEAEDAMAEGDIEKARKKLNELRTLQENGNTGELARLEGSLDALELLARPQKN